MKIKSYIPNAITLSNLFCGCMSVYMVFSGRPVMAAAFIILAALFDFFDGLVARMLKVSSDIGKDLDSLSDIVSFGVAPGFILFRMISDSPQLPESSYMGIPLLPLTALFVPLLSALRLARFNNDTQQKDMFLGLPTPACGLFIVSLSMMLMFPGNINNPLHIFFLNTLTDYKILILFSIILSILLVLPVPLISLKIKHLTFKDNISRIILIGTSLILVIFLGIYSSPFILILYYLVSLVFPPAH